MDLTWKVLGGVATVVGLVVGVATIVGVLNHHDLIAAVGHATPIVAWVFLGLVALVTLTPVARGKITLKKERGWFVRLIFYGAYFTPLACTGAAIYVLGAGTVGWVVIALSASFAALFVIAEVAEATRKRCPQCRDRVPATANFCPKCGYSLRTN
jgi:Uncharacterised protein family UPF0547